MGFFDGCVARALFVNFAKGFCCFVFFAIRGVVRRPIGSTMVWGVLRFLTNHSMRFLIVDVGNPCSIFLNKIYLRFGFELVAGIVEHAVPSMSQFFVLGNDIAQCPSLKGSLWQTITTLE
jgi:hypothetical protein